MKINAKKEIPSQYELSMEDITDLFIKFQNQHRNVFMYKFDNIVFFYRSLGRSEYKKIFNSDFDDMAKEELICETCTLWPNEFDFEDCDAGIPSVFAREILKNSFLDSPESRNTVLDYYRGEMFDLDNQITAIINEAFPNLDIEDIEAFDVDQTCKYLSRAEWKLHNLRGIPFREHDGFDNEAGERAVRPSQETARKQSVQTPTTEELGAEEKPSIRGGNKKEKLTPEKLRELQMKFPEIQWGHDSVQAEGLDAFKVSVDTESPALRPGF